jgi:hypothetical protein
MFNSLRRTEISLLFFALIVLIGCQTNSKYSILQEEPVCLPPCWEQITPGMTTKSDAWSILSANSAIQQPIYDRQTSIPARFESVIMFSLSDDKQQNGSLYIRDGKVAMMEFSLDSDLPLQRAIEIFGQPESVLVYRGGEYVGVSFFLPQKGIAYAYTSWAQSQNFRNIWGEPPDWVFHEIRSDVGINFLAYFVPNKTEPVLDSGFLSFGEFDASTTLQRLYPWDGYKSIDAYRPK